MRQTIGSGNIKDKSNDNQEMSQTIDKYIDEFITRKYPELYSKYITQNGNIVENEKNFEWDKII